MTAVTILHTRKKKNCMYKQNSFAFNWCIKLYPKSNIPMVKMTFMRYLFFSTCTGGGGGAHFWRISFYILHKLQFANFPFVSLLPLYSKSVITFLYFCKDNESNKTACFLTIDSNKIVNIQLINVLTNSYLKLW